MTKPLPLVCILAAGQSRRLGQAKQLIPRGEQTLLAERIATARITGCQVAVVLGADAEQMRPHCHQADHVLINTHWQTGQASSLHIFVREFESEAWLFMTVDQYRISSENLSGLINRWQKNPNTIVTSHYQQLSGVPAIFPLAYRAELLALTGDSGARPIIKTQQKQNAKCVKTFALPEAQFDIDTPEQYQQAINFFNQTNAQQEKQSCTG